MVLKLSAKGGNPGWMVFCSAKCLNRAFWFRKGSNRPLSKLTLNNDMEKDKGGGEAEEEEEEKGKEGAGMEGEAREVEREEEGRISKERIEKEKVKLFFKVK